MAAAQPNNADALIAAVRRDAFLATTDDNWTDARIMGIADDCILQYLAPALKGTKQDWFGTNFELELEDGLGTYTLPEEAMWSSIETAFLINQQTNTVAATLNGVASSNRGMYQIADTQNAGIPVAFYLDHYDIVLMPPPDANAIAAYSITVSAYRRPAQLCLFDDCVSVTAVNSVTQMLTTTTQPSTWASEAPDPYESGTPYVLDLYSRRLPNKRVLGSQTFTAPSLTALSFSPSITADEFAAISVGDVISLRGTSPFIDLPPEAVPFLRKMVQKTILTAQTDAQALSAYIQAQQTELVDFLRGMKNRADGTPKKLSLYNSAGARFIRSRRRW